MKSKKKTWFTLKDNRCPKCKEVLQKGMFGDGYQACQTEGCDFVIKDSTKEVIINRDNDE